jgi:AraC family transcriptional regulator of adaptative response/methylated-DNA-[protein]-cysteine methyltransferase
MYGEIAMQETDYERIESAIQYIETNFREQPSLKDVADSIGLSEYHFQRLFRRWAGISPKRFLQYLTAEYAKSLLQESQTVLDTAYDAGLSGTGRLHDLMVNIHAMTPGEVQALGAGLTISYGLHESPFGKCLIGVTERGICHLAFVSPEGEGDAIRELQQSWSYATLQEDPEITQPYIDRIFYPSDNANDPILLLVKGTNFQVKIWEALLRVPAGNVVTYGDIAEIVGDANASRAVGSAVGNNPVAYLIPCHRVIRKSGVLGEYRWGSARKKLLIGWEAAQASAQVG